MIVKRGTLSSGATLRTMRTLFAAFLTTWFLFLLVIRLGKPPETPVSPLIVTALALAALTDLAIGFTMRKRLLDPALETLARDRENSTALGQWRQGNLIGFCFAESITLFGLVLKFLGAGWNVAGVFFAAGLLLLLLWQPRLAPSA
jgi:F0F1-type ATP synthase membrane subunit c/vacuolar-type H+-ATPase subunit K